MMMIAFVVIMVVTTLLVRAVADKRHINATATGWTPAAGTLQSWTGVRSVDRSARPEIQTFSGDGDTMPTTKVVTFTDPQITVRFSDLNQANVAVVGQRGAFTTTINAAKQKVTVGGGGFTMALANAVIEDNTATHPHRNYGEATVTIGCESTDGLTNPLTFTPL